MFTTEGNTLDLQANDILFAQLYQYDNDGVLSSVEVNFDYNNPTEPCYVTFDSSKPLYAKMSPVFYDLNFDYSVNLYSIIIEDGRYIIAPNIDDVLNVSSVQYFNEIYVVNGLDINNTDLLLQLDNKHDNLYIDLVPFTHCDMLVDLRNIKNAKADLREIGIDIEDENGNRLLRILYEPYVYTSNIRVYAKPSEDVIDIMYKNIDGISNLIYKNRLRFTNYVSNYAELLGVENTLSVQNIEKAYAYSLNGNMHLFTDIGRFMVEFAQYTYEGVREICATNRYSSDRYTVVFDRNRPLYAEGVPESNYFNQTLTKYGLAQFTTNLHPPYPCVVNPSEGYGSDDYSSINIDTDVSTLVVGVKPLPFVVVHLDMTAFSSLGSTVSTKIQLDGYDAWTNYKPSTSSTVDLLLAFYPSDEDVTKYFDISVKLDDGSYQLYHRYSFNSNVVYGMNIEAVIVE